MRALAKLDLSLVLAAVAVVSCRHEKEPALPPSPIGQTHTTSALESTRSASDRPSESETVRLVVTSRIRALCNMPNAPPVPSDFAFDGSELRPRGEDVLYVVATCMTTPALAGHGVCISGIIEPHGVRDYELNLGRAHADAAVHYLEKLGIAKERTASVVRDGDGSTDEGRSEAVERRIEVDVRDSGPCLR